MNSLMKVGPSLGGPMTHSIGMKETAIDEKPIGEKISLWKIGGWDEWQQ